VSGGLPRRSPVEWVWRVLVVVSALLLAWFAFASAVAHVVRDSNPPAALQFVADDPVALSGRAEAVFAARSASALVSADTKQLVLQSLRAQALNPRALRQLGFIADASSQSAPAKQLIRLSERTSRREFGAQLWLIEDGIRSDNMRATLAHYDTALRSGSQNGTILYPILIAALDDVEVQSAFIRYIKSPPPWLGTFLYQAINQGENPAAIAATIMQAGRLPEGADYRDFERQLIGQLAAKARYQEMRQYYLSLANIDAKLPTAIGLSKSATNSRFAPISWEVQNNAGVGAAFVGSENGGKQSLNIFASSGERGSVLRKLLFLPAGRYTITQDIKLGRLNSGALATWEVKCLGGDGEALIWRGDLAPNAGRQTLPPFDISADCPVQSIVLIVSGGSNQEGSEMVLTDLSLNNIAR
jgi:hypothetical protein